MSIKALVGSGDRIGLFVLPFIILGLVMNFLWPAIFSVGGPPQALAIVSYFVLLPGLVVWIWSVVLILSRVPKGQLITTGPYAVVKHPLYTGVAWLVLPWVGFLLDSWLGAVLGLVLYVGSRLFSPAEERALSTAFGSGWEQYLHGVRLPWV